MDFELRQLRQFVVIADCGSFRAAAERLHIAQPALTVSIRKLENAVKAPLFVRTARGVILTKAGAAMLPEAKNTLHAAEQATAKARHASTGELGVIRLGFVGSAVYNLLPTILPDFKKKFPSIQLTLLESTSVNILDSITDGSLDIGILHLPIPQIDGLEVIPLETDRLHALLPVNHRLSGKRLVDLRDLAEDPFIIYSSTRVPVLHAAILSACASAGFVPKIAQEVTQAVTLLGLVGSELGVALVTGVISRLAGPAVRFSEISGCINPQIVLAAISLTEKANPSVPYLMRMFTEYRSTAPQTPA